MSHIICPAAFDIPRVTENISEIRDESIVHTVFQEIMRTRMEESRKIEELKGFLYHPYLSDGDKLELLTYYVATNHMNEKDVLELIWTIKFIPDCILNDLSWTIDNIDNLDSFTRYCWNNHRVGPLKNFLCRSNEWTLKLQQSLHTLIEDNKDSPQRVYSILELFDALAIDDLIVLLKPYAEKEEDLSDPYTRETVLERMLNSAVQNDLDQGTLNPEIGTLLPFMGEEAKSKILTHSRETGSKDAAIFLNANFIEYLFSAELSPDEIDYLISIDFLKAKPVSDYLRVLFSGNSPQAHRFINQWVQGTNSPHIFCQVLADNLGEIDEPSILCDKLDVWMRDPTLSDTEKAPLIDFIETTETEELSIWKYRYSEDVRNFRLIQKGSQKGKDGWIDQPQALAIVDELNRKAPSSVQFNKLRMKDELSGGTCSAMSLAFLRKYLEQRAQFQNPLEAFTAIAPDFATSSATFRTIQVAYNTILRKDHSDDFKQDKIAALLQHELPGATIDRVSALIDLNSEKSLDSLEFLYDTLPDGHYVVRALHPGSDSPDERAIFDPTINGTRQKEEVYGHTTIFVKEGGGRYYYDPATGPIQLNHSEQLGMILSWQNTRWALPAIRFYKIGHSRDN